MADTANFGESRCQASPLQIKIGDRFDVVSKRERLERDTADVSKTARVPNVDVRTGLQGTLLEYPWPTMP